MDSRPKPLPGVDVAAQSAYPLEPEDQVAGECFWSAMCRYLLLVKRDEAYARWLWEKLCPPYVSSAGRVPARPSVELVVLARAREWPVPERWS